MKLFILLSIMSFLFLGCASTDHDQSTADGLFAYAKEFDDSERYEVALQKYAEVKNKFPYSKLATESELAIADVHFKRESFPEAEVSYQNFRDLHPKHPKSDYVQYRIAMSFFMQLPDTIDRDLTPGQDAIYHFDQLIKLYPQSQYTAEAKEKKADVINRLAQKELYIADFYFKHEKYLAALRRYEATLVKFPNIGYDPRSHYGAYLSADKIQDLKKMSTHKQALLKQFPKSDETQKLSQVGDGDKK